MTTEDAQLHHELVEMLRNHSAQAGWLRTELERSCKLMVEALAVLKRGRSSEAKRAASELEFQIAGIDRTFALIQAANEAARAEIEAAKAEIEVRRGALLTQRARAVRPSVMSAENQPTDLDPASAPELEAAARQADFDARIRSALVPGQHEPPAGETIRTTLDGSMEAAPVTGQSPVDAVSPCGLADPSSRDCQNMKEVGGGFEGERYHCAICGKGYFLDYEDMK